MWEISENLHRAELTVLERSDQIARWAELASKVLQLATPGGKQPKESGIRKAARELNKELTEVHRAVKVASLTPEAKQAAQERGLNDNQSALLVETNDSTPSGIVAMLYGARESHMSKDDEERAIRELLSRQASEWREPRLIQLDGPGPYVLPPLGERVSVLTQEEHVVLELQLASGHQRVWIPLPIDAVPALHDLLTVVVKRLVPVDNSKH